MPDAFTTQQQMAEQPLTWSQLIILRAVANGHADKGQICAVLNITRRALGEQIAELTSRGLVQEDGLILKSLRITPFGMDTLATYGHQPDIPEPSSFEGSHGGEVRQGAGQARGETRQEIRHTTTLGTGFKLVFGGTIGLFAALVVIWLIISIAYWVGYYFLIKPHIPAFLLPYLPFGNFPVALLLGLVTSVAFFRSLLRRLNPMSYVRGG